MPSSFAWAGSQLKVVYYPQTLQIFPFNLDSRGVSVTKMQSGSSLCFLLGSGWSLFLALPPLLLLTAALVVPCTAASPSILLKLISKIPPWSRCFPCVSPFIFFPAPTCSNASNNLFPWSFWSNPKTVQAPLINPPGLLLGQAKTSSLYLFPMIIHGGERKGRFNLGTAFGSHFTFRLSTLAMVSFVFLPGMKFYLLEIFW